MPNETNETEGLGGPDRGAIRDEVTESEGGVQGTDRSPEDRSAGGNGLTFEDRTKIGGPGRPKGSKNGVTLLREAVMAKSEDIILEHFPKIVEAVVEEAKKGDMKAAKLIMDRVLPARKSVEHLNQGGGGIKIVVQGIQPKVDIEDAEYETASAERHEQSSRVNGSEKDPT